MIDVGSGLDTALQGANWAVIRVRPTEANVYTMQFMDYRVAEARKFSLRLRALELINLAYTSPRHRELAVAV